MSTDRPISFPKLKVACHHCSLSQLCVPAGLDRVDVERLDKMIERRRILRRGEQLFRAGDRLHALYAVHSGVLKTSVLTDEGDEQVTGFHLPGELVGLGALGSERHGCAATALDTASVCELPLDGLEKLAIDLPSLNHQLRRLMGQEITREGELVLLLGKKSAPERLAAFLLGLSERLALRGLSSCEFNLSMSRKDIGNFLGLTLETVSRTFTHLQAQALINVTGKYVQITDLKGLQELSHSRAGTTANRRA
ncbi:MAG: fumarate/nitrate reduction transcriptional regulator Fnr [Gammaproteobacteria bacterium]|nr:MAG: fumarate/nitrate reduction transcriptional regulator Fnr [Gammaproteobacteria bacterium]